jgi:hypothetical protein
VVTSNDDLYADLDYITTRPNDSITVVEENFALRGPRSRSDSVASSARKSDEWHPYDRPAPEYVLKELWPLFHDDPTPDPSSEATKRAIMRAFHQADYSDESFLTRRAVLQHLSKALEHSPMMSHSDGFESMVLSFDANHDGQSDEGEFLLLIQELMRCTAQARNMQIEADFAEVIQKARTDAAYRRARDSRFFIRWGFSKQPGVGQQYIDDILQASVATIPKVLADTAFSVIAWKANICVNKISDFAEQWIGTVSKLLQSEYLDPLRKVQRVATAFTLLENQEARVRLSDLDTFLDCARIASYLSDGKDI